VTSLAWGSVALVWAGAALALSGWRGATRPSLADRLRPYSPGGSLSQRRGPSSVGSFWRVMGPLASDVGDRVAALLGVVEPAALRLRRIHSPMGPTEFRTRQAAGAGLAAVAGAAVALGAHAIAPIAVLMVVGGPLLVFMVLEQRLAGASQKWRRDVSFELPVVSEQLAMLLSAGYSLGSALARVASRGRGCVATDLAVVVNRVRQGLTEVAALREWADVAQVDGVNRLVSVLSLHGDAADLARMVSAEARNSRRDLHRLTIEAIERRSQQVWVPVTVATLVPGVILLAVPFVSALRLFSNT
jgi:tight adherence protein C